MRNLSERHQRITVTGRIMDSADCKAPIVAKIEIWHGRFIKWHRCNWGPRSAVRDTSVRKGGG